jgi:hypothetical protein
MIKYEGNERKEEGNGKRKDDQIRLCAHMIPVSDATFGLLFLLLYSSFFLI